jgi:hypothetical protein
MVQAIPVLVLNAVGCYRVPLGYSYPLIYLTVQQEMHKQINRQNKTKVKGEFVAVTDYMRHSRPDWSAANGSWLQTWSLQVLDMNGIE